MHICTLIAALLLATTQAYGLQNFNQKEEQWQFDLVQQGFFTSSNYDGNGKTTSLSNGRDYKHFLFQLDTSYNFTEAISVLGSVGGAYAQSSDGSFTRTATQPTDVSLGLQYLFRTKALWMAPEFSVSNPLTTFDETTDQVLVNEGVMQVTGKLNLLKVWGRKFQNFGYLGYTWQADDRASWFPWQFGSRLRIGKPWIGLQFRGQVVYQEDARSASSRKAVTDRVDGGSLRYFSPAPTYTEATVFLEFLLSKATVMRLSGGTTVAGVNSAQGYLYTIGLNYALGGKTLSSDYFHISHLYKREKQLERQRLKKFKIKEDEEDPSLFPEDE